MKGLPSRRGVAAAVRSHYADAAAADMDTYPTCETDLRGDWGLKGPLAQKILIAIKIFNQLGFYESHICPLLKAI